MNDKQQLAAMGEHLAEQQPMCMAKRIEELEAQVRAMAELLRDEFETFTSVEDNQEQDMTQQQEVKQDNGWFERGELPPVGTECERRAESGNGFYRVFVVGHGEMLGIKVGFYARSHNADSFNCSPSACFRPIRTDRDEAIEVMKAHCPYPGSWETAYRLFAESLYDAGYRAGGSE